VVLTIARSNCHTNIEPWRVTATGFRHRDTYPLALRKALPPMPDLRGTPRPLTNEVFSSCHQNPNLAGPHEKPGTTPPPRRPAVPHSCLPHLPGQTL
jgi:hypothetical protein